jgi:hypothetical protein
MPPKLKKPPAAAEGGVSVLDRIKAQKAEQPAAEPAPAAKKSLKAKQALDLAGKGPLDVLGLLGVVRSGEAKWCRKCVDLFNPTKSDTQQCPQSHPNFTYVKPAPELKAQLEEAEARIVKAATAVQGGARGRAARRTHGPSGRAATRLQCAARSRAAKRAVQCRRAQRKLAQGEAAASTQDWEAAIEALNAGLAVESTRDDELTASLRAALEGAEASKAARDEAREKAEAHLAEGDGLVSARDYPKAIDALQAGLELDTQSDEIKGRLQESLATAEAGLAAQEAARQEAAAHLATAEQCLESHNHNGAIAAYEAAMALDVNDDAFSAAYKSGLAGAQDALAVAVDAARAKLAEGEAAVSSENWEAAIDALNAGLAVEGTHDDELTASLRTALEGAEASKAARDAAEAAAEAERQRIAAEEAAAEEQRQQEAAEQARIAAEAAEAEAAAEAARVAAAAEAERAAAEAARLAALPVPPMPAFADPAQPAATSDMSQLQTQAPSAAAPALPEGLPPFQNQVLSNLPPPPAFAANSTTASNGAESSTPAFDGLMSDAQRSGLFGMPQPEPEPEPEPQQHGGGASDTPLFDALMASAAGGLDPQLLAQAREFFAPPPDETITWLLCSPDKTNN